MKMKSISRGPFKYAGALVQPQAEFSVKSARDAKVLAVMKRAALVSAPVVVVQAPAAPEKRTYKRRDMVAETAAPVEAAEQRWSGQVPPLRNPSSPKQEDAE